MLKVGTRVKTAPGSFARTKMPGTVIGHRGASLIVAWDSKHPNGWKGLEVGLDIVDGKITSAPVKKRKWMTYESEESVKVIK